MDLSQETQATLDMYGVGTTSGPTISAAAACIARRLVERGVRFIQLYSGGNHNDDNWDAHGDLVKNHDYHAGNTDQPIAALLQDLKERGLLDSARSIVWGGEFGRQPTAEYAAGTGRDHNSYGFTMWMAGGGIKGGQSVGDDRRTRRRRRRRPVPRQAPARHRALANGPRPQSAVLLLQRARPEARRRRRSASDQAGDLAIGPGRCVPGHVQLDGTGVPSYERSEKLVQKSAGDSGNFKRLKSAGVLHYPVPKVVNCLARNGKMKPGPSMTLYLLLFYSSIKSFVVNLDAATQ